MLNSFKTLILLGGLTLAIVPANAAVHFGAGVFVGPVYRPFGYGPYWGGYGPGPYSARIYMPPTHSHQGQIKFDTRQQESQVYIDGAYAGTVRDVNSAWLAEGSHSLELREPGGARFDEDVYVVAGKSIHLNPSQMTPVKS